VRAASQPSPKKRKTVESPSVPDAAAPSNHPAGKASNKRKATAVAESEVANGASSTPNSKQQRKAAPSAAPVPTTKAPSAKTPVVPIKGAESAAATAKRKRSAEANSEPNGAAGSGKTGKGNKPSAPVAAVTSSSKSPADAQTEDVEVVAADEAADDAVVSSRKPKKPKRFTGKADALSILEAVNEAQDEKIDKITAVVVRADILFISLIVRLGVCSMQMRVC